MLKNKTKLVFLSSDSIAIPCLEALLNEYDVLVVTKSDKQQKRSNKKRPNEFANYCERKGLKLLKVNKLDKTIIQKLQNHQADYAVCFSFGLIIPNKVLDLYPNKLLNIHPSALPIYRGPSPIQAALLNNDPVTAISFMIMNSKMDEGDIIKQFTLDISSDDTYTSLANKIAKLANEQINNILTGFIKEDLLPSPQSKNNISYCKMIDKKEAEINFSEPARVIYNKYRGYYEWPKIFTYWNGKKLVLSEIEIYLDSTTNYQVGVVYKHGNNIFIQAKGGSIKLNRIQLEGKKNMPIKAFVNGHGDFIGTILG